MASPQICILFVSRLFCAEQAVLSSADIAVDPGLTDHDFAENGVGGRGVRCSCPVRSTMSRVMQAAMPEIKCRNGPTDLEVAGSVGKAAVAGSSAKPRPRDSPVHAHVEIPSPEARGDSAAHAWWKPLRTGQSGNPDSISIRWTSEFRVRLHGHRRSPL